MIQLISFGEYQFDNIGKMLSDQFANVVQRATRLPGLDGGFDQHGVGRAPSEIGNIRFDGLLSLGSASSTQAERDKLRGIANWGVRRLVIQTADPVQPLRWTWARLSSLNDPVQISARPEHNFAVSLTFQVAYPRWFDYRPGDVFWGGGAQWGDGSSWGGGLQVVSYTGATQDIPIHNRGNADALPIIFVATNAAQSLSDVRLQRITNGHLAEDTFYQASMGEHETLVMDCRARAIRHQGVGAYQDFTFTSPQWLTIPPGQHTLRMTGAGDAIISLDFYNTWI